MLSALLSARSLQEEPWGERGPVVSWGPGASHAALLPGTIRGLQGKSFRGNPSGGILQGESSPGGAGPGTGEGTHELPAGFVLQGKTSGLRWGCWRRGTASTPLILTTVGAWGAPLAGLDCSPSSFSDPNPSFGAGRAGQKQALRKAPRRGTGARLSVLLACGFLQSRGKKKKKSS